MTDNNFWTDRRIRTGYMTAGELAKRYNRQNWRIHPELQQQAVEGSLDELGFIGQIKLSEVPVDKVFDGHLRIELTLLRFGEDCKMPVDWYNLDEQETKRALMYHDLSTQMAEANLDILSELRLEIPDINPAFDEFMDLEFDFGDNGSKPGTPEQARKTLAERFGVPPFSVLDARQGYWQERKRVWLALGIESELGRGEDIVPNGGVRPPEHDGCWQRGYSKRKPNATPGGSLLEAAGLGKDGKTVRDDGRGRPITRERERESNKDGDAQRPDAKKKKVRRNYARCFVQDLMRGEHKVGKAKAR